jgi:CheY-like chemotaxis protein
MIVDDNGEMRTLIRSILADVAQEFVECPDGKVAVDVYPAERPDWTLMDIVMPIMDGLTATRQILAQFPAARIIAITQQENLKLRDSARSAGACGFLGKEHLTQLDAMLRGEPGTTPGLAIPGR